MTEPEAFKWIQRAAMDRRTTMKRVAEVVLETLDSPKESGDSLVKSVGLKCHRFVTRRSPNLTGHGTPDTV